MMTLHLARRLASFLLLCSLLFPLSILHAENRDDTDLVPPAILLAQHYTPSVNPAHYLISEKLDGVRAYWDGQRFRFRSGRVIVTPAWYTARFPSYPLDGELWMGRRQFDQTSSVLRRLDSVDADWEKITYQLYELPGGAGTFSDRVDALKTIVEQMNVPWVQVVPQFRVADNHALQVALQHVIQLGGEGLMLHRADAHWQTGRSDVLLKLKEQLDAEAIVLAHLPGKGKYLGMLGALLVEMPNGIRFNIGTGFTDEQRRNPPEIGSVVTYRYRDLTPQGIPRFASFLRVREDE